DVPAVSAAGRGDFAPSGLCGGGWSHLLRTAWIERPRMSRIRDLDPRLSVWFAVKALRWKAWSVFWLRVPADVVRPEGTRVRAFWQDAERLGVGVPTQSLGTRGNATSERTARPAGHLAVRSKR